MDGQVETRLLELIESKLDAAPSVLLGVNAPFLDFRWQGAAGSVERHGKVPVTPAHQFRIASMSKTFTGVLCAQLMEQDRLDVDRPVNAYLPEELSRMIPVVPGARVDDITVRMLLNHRSGLHDFALSSAWRQEIRRDPMRFRPPLEIATWALNHSECVGPPGAQYHYSDTGFVLLGLLAEHMTGQPYWQLCREQIFDRLGMDATWLEGHEEPRGELSHPYACYDGKYDDAMRINGCLDWAAGGHVAGVTDIDKFLRGVFNGALFSDPATLDRFLRGTPGLQPGFFYGFGVGRKVIHGKTLWGHLGHWGSFMYYCPEDRLSFSGTQNYSASAHNEFIREILGVIYPG